MKSIFDKCSSCKVCCHSGDGRLVIPLIDKERIRLKRDELKVKGNCEFLGKDGCTLKEKPISCTFFPLIFQNDWVVYEDCPLAKHFKEQMTVGKEPLNHYIRCLKLTTNLTTQEKERLSKLYLNLIR